MTTTDAGLSLETNSVSIEVSLDYKNSIKATTSFSVRIGYNCVDASLSLPSTNSFTDDSIYPNGEIKTLSWTSDSSLVEINTFLECGSYTFQWNQEKDGSGTTEIIDTSVFTVNQVGNSIQV